MSGPLRSVPQAEVDQLNADMSMRVREVLGLELVQLTRDELREIGNALGVFASLIERNVLTHDTDEQIKRLLALQHRLSSGALVWVAARREDER